MGAVREQEGVKTEKRRSEEKKNEASATEGEATIIPPSPPTFEEAEITEIGDILGYRFHDKVKVVEALTHASYYLPAKATEVGGLSYERLEFMGDAVLNCMVARELLASYPDLLPGPLTRLRAANVDTEKLARVAMAGRLHRFLRHKVPSLNGQIKEFEKATLDYPIHSNGLLDPPKVLADIVESLLGAVFVDSNSNLETVWRVFKRLSDPLINLETLGKHPVTELFELCQKRGMKVSFMKETWSESTIVEVMVDGKIVGSATYGQKKEIAQNRAAKAALDRLKLSLDGDWHRPS